MSEQNVVIVLGMHRSGTSVLAGILQQAGVKLGEVASWSPHNALGNREHAGFRDLNDAVLTFSKGAWDSIPRRLHWTLEHEKERDSLIRRYDSVAIWGFKDPRSLLTLDFWLAGLSRRRIHFIGTVRHPMAVSLSLREREPRKDPALCIRLWLRYNQRLYRLWAEQPFPILDFDRAPKDYARAARKAVVSMDVLARQPTDCASFFDPSLRHQQPDAGTSKRDDAYRSSDVRAAEMLHRAFMDIAVRP